MGWFFIAHDTSTLCKLLGGREQDENVVGNIGRVSWHPYHPWSSASGMVPFGNPFRKTLCLPHSGGAEGWGIKMSPLLPKGCGSGIQRLLTETAPMAGTMISSPGLRVAPGLRRFISRICSGVVVNWVAMLSMDSAASTR